MELELRTEKGEPVVLRVERGTGAWRALYRVAAYWPGDDMELYHDDEGEELYRFLAKVAERMRKAQTGE